MKTKFTMGLLLLLLVRYLALEKYSWGCRLSERRVIHDQDSEDFIPGVEDDFGLSNEQRSRLNAVERECKKYEKFLDQQKWEDSVPHLIVDDSRKLLFCAIPKVASSNWKRVFIDALNITINGTKAITDVHEKNLLPDLRLYSKAEQEFRLKNYFKFMFVREPLERLLSAYKNKIEHREIEWVSKKRHLSGRLGEVVLRVRNPGIQFHERGRTLTFSQFVNTLTDPEYNIKHYNVHWKQYAKLCHPCFVRYDFIGKMETFAEDLMFVKRKTGLEYQAWFDQSDRKTTSLIVQEYYKALSPRKITTLLRMYESDITMFGYD